MPKFYAKKVTVKKGRVNEKRDRMVSHSSSFQTVDHILSMDHRCNQWMVTSH